ncbi:tripartite motif-containing protein 59-like [Macrobrachium nipponense]|uniref:tripartite motif-containing protein 59-like n=1 Tax=Macrobrachium nipponense TaxID=159736 RepID=UPI0030C8C7F8
MDCTEDLQCSVCIQLYSDKSPPKNLPCGHSVCSSCMDQLMLDSGYCPECRKSLKSKEMKDCSVNIPLLRLCRLHAFVTSGKEDLPPVDLNFKPLDSKPLASEGTCPLHGHPLFFFCLPCDALVCRGCLISDHPDQPYGRCLIRSVEEKRQMMINAQLEVLEEHHKKSLETKNNLTRMFKGCKIAVGYWEKRAEPQKDEEQERNLQEARDIHDVVKKDLDIYAQWTDYFREAVENLKAATTIITIESVTEKAKEKIPEFEKLEIVDRKDDVVKVLMKFWNGQSLFW